MPHAITAVTAITPESLPSDTWLPFLAGLQRGIEKESLRVTPDGRLSQAPHPQTLGSALTHPHITTDFSEALIELITDPHPRPEDTLAQLDRLHRFTQQQIGEEYLWAASMPCLLGPDDSIPIAQYGSSHIGRMKTVYRHGLSWRYGRRMQTIAGIHYNFSLPEAFWPWLQQQQAHPEGWQALRDERYFGLIRNFRRHSWLLLYLFGASPALCQCFLDGRPEPRLQNLGFHSASAPWGTSLRMGDLGYQSNAQENLYVCYNHLDGYIDSLHQALNTPVPEYTQIGVKVDGNYRQLRDTLLQIENEFYSSIRPKRATRSGQTPSAALREGGVQYVEVRCMDLNPFLPLGIDEETMRFLDLFLIDNLLRASPPTTPDEYTRIRQNTLRTVYTGRDLATTLLDGNGERPLHAWAHELLAPLDTLAEQLDNAEGGTAYRQSLAAQRHKLAQPETTPAGRMLEHLEREGCSYFDFVQQQSRRHAADFRARPLPAAEHETLVQAAHDSLQRQAAIETANHGSFDDFLSAYFRQS